MAKKNGPVKKAKPSKRRKLNTDTVPALNDDVLEYILAFCPMRTLLSVVSCSKALVKNVLSYELVVSTILSDKSGRARKTMEKIMALLQDKKIFRPSPLRLLRLLNAHQVCENCHYHVEPAHDPCIYYGLYMCVRCDGARTKTIWTRTRKWQSNSVLQDKVYDHRTAMEYFGSSKHLVWNEDYYTVDGERAGPIVTWDILQRDMSLDEHFESLGDLVPTDEQVQALKDTFDPVQKKALKNEAEEDEKKAQRLEAYRNKKKAKCESVIEQVEGMLEVPWKEFALQHSFPNWHPHRIDFEQKLVGELLRPFMIAPSKVTKQSMKDVANQINEKYALLYSKGIPDFACLNDSYLFDSTLRTYLQRKHPTPADLLKEITVDNLSEESPLALWHINCHYGSKYGEDQNVARILLEADGINDPEDFNLFGEASRRYENLALKLWNQESLRSSVPTMEEARTRFDEALRKFRLLRPKLEEYWNRPETREFLNQDDFIARRNRDQLVYQEFWISDEDAEKVQQWLLSSDFAAVQNYYEGERRPQAWLFDFP